MRDYAIHESRMRQSHGGLTRVARIYRNWRDRRVARRVLSLDDHLLADIGLQRSDVRWLLKQPLTSDLGFEYERLRRHHEVHGTGTGPHERKLGPRG